MSTLCCETGLNSFTDFGKVVAIHIAEYCKLLHEHSVLEPPGLVDCWHTQHFFVSSRKKITGGLDLEIWGPQTLVNNSILPIKFSIHTTYYSDSYLSCVWS
jgi:hypothetical protein